ncbi:MAG TPA: cysteine desulfurase family protein [Bdellovibrionales bacterium]|nr:cysteine desulfurase family protein [Bdellovibrionales bacterium]
MPIYMDHNATTPIDPRVAAAMRPYLEEMFGNASSASHAYGWQAQSAVKKAREQVAGLLGCRATDVLWTSGATESNNMAILGLVKNYCPEKPHLITQATEHKAVLEVIEAAQDLGAEVTVLGVDEDGRIRMDELRAAIRPSTLLISIMMANNEVGTLQPVREIGELCKEKRIVFHTDAAQSACKFPFNLKELNVDMISLSGHKIYGPKGVGALAIRPVNREFELKPLLYGGEQERRLRPGTLNVPGIVGFGEACSFSAQELREECERLQAWRDELIKAVEENIPGARLNGPRAGRLCNNVSFSFSDVTPDDMALGIAGLAYSAGSACNSSNPKPSHVLKAMGLSDQLARSTLRLGLGRFTTQEDVATVKAKLFSLARR